MAARQDGRRLDVGEALPVRTLDGGQPDGLVISLGFESTNSGMMIDQ